MINNSFYSQNNINILKSIIKDELNININKNHEIIINETMKYVENNAGSNPPSNMSNKDYLFLMNKKVYDIVLPVIKNSVTKVNNTTNTIEILRSGTTKWQKFNEPERIEYINGLNVNNIFYCASKTGGARKSRRQRKQKRKTIRKQRK